MMNEVEYAKWQYKRACRVFRVLDDDRINQEYWSDRYDELTGDIEDVYCRAALGTWVTRNKKPVYGAAWWELCYKRLKFGASNPKILAKIKNHIDQWFIPF